MVVPHSMSTLPFATASMRSAASSAIQSTFNAESPSRFWTDAAILGHAGIPSVLFGPGGAGLHSIEEFVKVTDVVTVRDALAELADVFC